MVSVCALACKHRNREAAMINNRIIFNLLGEAGSKLNENAITATTA
jgi:hypothetical protein